MKKQLLILTFYTVLSHFASGQQLNMSWAGFFEGPQSYSVAIGSMVTDHSGNNLLMGSFSGTIDFSIDATQTNVTALTTKDNFVAKYSPSGTLLWVYPFSPATYNSFDPKKIECTQNNDIIISGTLKDTIDVDASVGVFELIPVGTANTSFVMKIDEAGNFQWAMASQQATANSPSGGLTLNSFTIDSNDDIIFCGIFSDTVDMDFGPGTVLDTAASFNTDGFLLKIGAAGNYIWHRTFKGSGDNFLGSITTDATNTIYCTGSFALNNDFDPGPGVFFLSYAGLSDGVVITLDAAGNFIRAWKPGYCTSTDIPAKIVLDEFGFIYLLGSWEGTMDFDPGPGVFQMFATGTSSKYLMKLNKYGHSLWALQVGYALSGSDFISPNTMTYDETNGLLLSGSFTLDYDFDPSPGSTYTVLHNGTDGFLLQLDNNGNFGEVAIYTSQGNETVNSHVVSPSGSVYAAGYFTNTVDFDPGPGIYTLTVGSSSTFFTCLNSQSNYASGNVYRDMNLNAIFDAGDFVLDHTVVHTSEGRNFLTSGSGNYTALFDTGTVSLSYTNLPPSSAVVPASYTVSNSSYGNFDAGKDFAVQVPAGITNGSVIVTNTNLTRAGRTSYLHLLYTNNGTTPISGDISLVTDPLLSFNSSSTPPSLVTGDTVKWNFSGLLPQQTITINIQAMVSPACSIGTVLENYATLYSSTGDVFMSDNTDSLTLVVTGSFDPNDKQVVPMGDFTTQQISNGEYLEYTIRFQNTGNDTAFIVQIVDTLNTLLDVTTFEVMDASHPYLLNLSANYVLRFIFDNILLPDSTTNEEMSHGFIRYRIKPLQGTAPGAVITNNAAIYFDLNSPVITNTTTTSVILPSSVSEIQPSILQLYPNPVKDVLHLTYFSSGKENIRIEIYDLFGQKVAELFNGPIQNRILSKEFDFSNLASGVYVILLHGSTTMQKKIVKL